MTLWQTGLIALAGLTFLYAALVGALVLAGRRADAGALARFVPDCVVLFRRLLSDPRVSRSRKILVLALLAYLIMPLDLVPDFIPVAGQLDDAILVALVLRSVMRAAGTDLIRDCWPGPEASLNMIVRLSGRPAQA